VKPPNGLTQRERQNVENHADESVGNVEGGVFAEQVSDDPEPFGEPETKRNIFRKYSGRRRVHIRRDEQFTQLRR